MDLRKSGFPRISFLIIGNHAHEVTYSFNSLAIGTLLDTSFCHELQPREALRVIALTLIHQHLKIVQLAYCHLGYVVSQQHPAQGMARRK